MKLLIWKFNPKIYSEYVGKYWVKRTDFLKIMTVFLIKLKLY